jgi:hypothetical protein
MRRNSVLAAGLLACLASADVANAAAPTFFARFDYSDLGAPWVAVADTNGDGIPDMIALHGGPSALQVLFGNGNGAFRQGPETQTGMQRAFSFATADLNSDGKADLGPGWDPA